MIWEKVLSTLKEEVSPFDFETYISLIKYDESASKSNVAVLVVPNPYIESWIKSNYALKIAHIFEMQTKIKPEIRFSLSKEKPRKTHTKAKSGNMQVSYQSQYTFENFVVGDSNRHAYTVAQMVANTQAKAYNPVLFYGNTGLGKTHLLCSIGNFAQGSGKTVIYLTTEEFMNDFQRHLNTVGMDAFRDIYRNCDYLLIDDIQFLGGKVSLQEEFFNTFEALYKTNKQIVMTSDKLPKQIQGLEERLRSRFESGIKIDIQPPGVETRIQIIAQKCVDNKISMEKEVINYLAENISENVRQIEGVIAKMRFHNAMTNQPISVEMAKSVLDEILLENQEEITVEKIVRVIARELNVKISEITSGSRVPKIVQARHIVLYLIKDSASNMESMSSVASRLGLKNHATVSKALTKITKQIQEDENLKHLIVNLKNKIQNEKNL